MTNSRTPYVRTSIRRLPSLAVLLLLIASRSHDPVYLDIYSGETDRNIVFGNAQLELHVDKRRGEWIDWRDKTSSNQLLTTDSARQSLDFCINGTYLIAKHGATFLRKEISIAKDRMGCILSVTVGVLPQQIGHEYELTTYYRLYPGQKRLERWARLVRNRAGGKEHLDGFRFQLPGVVIGEPGENTVALPGPFFPKTFVAPDTPYDSLKAKNITFHQAPDAGFGLFLLSNKVQKTTLGSWMSTGGEVAYSTAIAGNGQTIMVRHDDKRAYYLLPEMAVESDVQHRW